MSAKQPTPLPEPGEPGYIAPGGYRPTSPPPPPSRGPRQDVHVHHHHSEDRIRELEEQVERLSGKLRIVEAHSLSNNLCPDHRDKQQGKPCLACTIERLARENEEALYRPLGDNHHNAAKCPYCSPTLEADREQLAAKDAEIERLNQIVENQRSEGKRMSDQITEMWLVDDVKNYENRRLREALRPFSTLGCPEGSLDNYHDLDPDCILMVGNDPQRPGPHNSITAGDVRRARSALSPHEPGGEDESVTEEWLDAKRLLAKPDNDGDLDLLYSLGPIGTAFGFVRHNDEWQGYVNNESGETVCIVQAKSLTRCAVRRLIAALASPAREEEGT